VKPGLVADASSETNHALAFGRQLLLDVSPDATFLTANTERQVVETWCEGTHYQCLALDGPALLELATSVDADVGIMVGYEKTLALGADDREIWPRRSLTPNDF
jgi:hypothetical protein